MVQRRARLALLTLLAVLAGPPAAQADLAAAPWYTTNGTCTGNASVQSSTQAASRDRGVARVSATTQLAFPYYDAGDDPAVGAGDIAWVPTRAVDAGEKLGLSINCSYGTTPYTVAFYDQPGTPVTYAGRATYNSFSTANSWLPFTAPARTPYVADVTIDNGALELTEGYDTTTIASSQIVDLGVLDAGKQTLRVRALNGPSPNWTVTVHGVPVTVSAVKPDTPYAAPGAIQTISYTINGDTQITATITGPGGVVRTLAQNLPQKLGTNQFTWDARGAGAQSLPDGTYTITVTSQDAHGGTTSSSGTTTIDGTAPTITNTTPDRIKPAGAVTADLADRGSGLDKTLISLEQNPTVPDKPDSYTSSSWYTSKDPAHVSVGAMNGWTLGQNKVTILSFDKAGNRAVKTITFTAATTTGTSGATSRPTARWKQCGSVGHAQGLRTRGGTTCRLAVKISKRVWVRGTRIRPNGYRCVVPARNSVSCTKGTRTVRWTWRNW